MSYKVSISPAWLRVIMFCSKTMPYGQINLRIIAGSPTDILLARRTIRADKPETFGPFLIDVLEDGVEASAEPAS